MLVHHRLKGVVGGHCGVVGRGDGAVHGRRGAVHAIQGALRGHHALQHVKGRLVCLAAMLLPCAATCPSVARAAAVARGAIAGASALLSSFGASRDWMAAALLPEAAVFTSQHAQCPTPSDTASFHISLTSRTGLGCCEMIYNYTTLRYE